MHFLIFLFQLFQRDEMTSSGQASSLTNMFDPHIYAYQSLISGSNSNPTIQSMPNDVQQKNQSPTSSPQKTMQMNSNFAPVQNSGTLTPRRKQSQQEDGTLRDISVVAEIGHSEIITTTHLMQAAGSGTSSTNNSRKTSTVSDNTSNETTPENTVLTPKPGLEQTTGSDQQKVLTPTTAYDANLVKQSPVRKLSRFLVSPTVIETANHELIVQEGSQAPASSPQQADPQQSIEMNINEENYQRLEVPETELQPQQSIGFRMPETLEQLKIELENITHAHVSTKAKELAQQTLLQGAQNLENDDSHEQVSEAQLESGAEGQSMEAIGSITTGDNTSVYNSRRTSADINTNQTDLTSTASGAFDNEESLVSEPVQMAMDDAAPKVIPPVQQQMSIDR